MALIRNLLVYSSLILFCTFATAQEGMVPATINTWLLTHGNVKQLRTEAPKSGALLELPFIDDFSSDRFPGNANGYEPLWMGRQATRNDTWAKNPPTIGVVSFDGANEVGYPYQWGQGAGPADTLLSVPINLEGSPADNIGISFYYQPKGLANLPPSAGTDSLILEFFAPELDQWFWVWSTLDLSNTETFTFVYIPIFQTRFLKPGFQFRFRNIANLQGFFDLWHLDYVWIERNLVNATPVVNDVAFIKPLPSVLKDYTAIPLSHYVLNPASHMVESVTLPIRNLNDGPRTLEGNRIRVFGNGVELGNFPNANAPAISGNSVFDYGHSFGNQPNGIVLDAGIDPESVVYEVEFSHGVSDFAQTATNDTMRVRHEFFTHYAYDDGSAEAGYFVSGSGSEAAIRFSNLKTDSVWGLQIYTMPSGTNYENTPITIRLYQDAGSGPGAIIAEQFHTVVYGQDEYQQSIIYKFEEPIYMESGSYFAGYRQANQSNSLIIGLDFNTNANQGRLYFKQGPAWSPSSVPGSVMIRPMFTSPGYEIIAGTRNPTFAERLAMYPNPASATVRISDRSDAQPLSARVFDMRGKLVASMGAHEGNTLHIAHLPNGMYIVRIADPTGNAASKKLVVNR